jgi:hypothetical protein
MWRRRGPLLCAVVLAQLSAATAAWSFTATPAAHSVIAKVRTEARHLVTVRTERTGALVYCSSAPEGWTYALQPGCRTPARVTEVDDVHGGHVERIIGRVTAAHRPTFNYVVDSSGWYRSTAGSGCWTLELGVFVAAPLIGYPLPGTHVSIRSSTSRRIVIEAVSHRSAYTVLDYINPRTFFDYRDVEITYANHKAYRVYDRSMALHERTRRPSTKPTCVSPLATTRQMARPASP